MPRAKREGQVKRTTLRSNTNAINKQAAAAPETMGSARKSLIMFSLCFGGTHGLCQHPSVRHTTTRMAWSSTSGNSWHSAYHPHPVSSRKCRSDSRNIMCLYVGATDAGGTEKDSERFRESTVEQPAACVEGFSPSAATDGEVQELLAALRHVGFRTVSLENPHPQTQVSMCRYVYSKATGMLKLLSAPSAGGDMNGEPGAFDPPRWVPVVRGEENVLVANGWSFLDPDESEPTSAFDVDAANEEGQYHPKWGSDKTSIEVGGRNAGYYETVSSLGYDLRRMTSNEVLTEAETTLSTPLSRSVLLDGMTDPPNRKVTNNQFNFNGPTGQSDIERGVFACAIGGLPLFTTIDLSPTTASSGWLSFSCPLSDDHIVRLKPEDGAADRRVEVICARSGCHLGHHFGKGEGYCINASTLNFIPEEGKMKFSDATLIQTQSSVAHPKEQRMESSELSRPISWPELESEGATPSVRLLQSALRHTVKTETVVFGAGCFWHVEFALRRLRGIVCTEVGYAGGTTTSPTYEQVCKEDTGHAEVVRVTFDPVFLEPSVLFDCFLSMHDPTMVRSHGKRAKGTGQYRSVVFVANSQMQAAAMQCLDVCQDQLGKTLSTDFRLMEGKQWFWKAEKRHQRHDERVKSDKETTSLSATQWLGEYGRRRSAVWGTSETMGLAVDDQPGDDGMAMMMI